MTRALLPLLLVACAPELSDNLDSKDGSQPDSDTATVDSAEPDTSTCDLFVPQGELAAPRPGLLDVDCDWVEQAALPEMLNQDDVDVLLHLGAHTATVYWADGERSQLTLEVRSVNNQRTYLAGEGFEGQCEAVVAADLDLHLVSDDGLIDEEINATVAGSESMFIWNLAELVFPVIELEGCDFDLVFEGELYIDGLWGSMVARERETGMEGPLGQVK